MMRDRAGNNLQQARAIVVRSHRKTYRDHVSELDSEDVYRFRLKKLSSFNLQLKGLKANTDVELVKDRNRNGQIDLGERVASSRAPQRQQDRIHIQGLAAGTYFIRVFPQADQGTRYRLILSARPIATASFTYAVIQRTNQIRQSRGLAPLALNTQLSQAAQAYAKSMATQDFFSHRGADGSTWQERIRATGYHFSDAAENLAIGHRNPASVIQGWMNSPGHRANMLAHQVQEIGVGYFYMERDGGRVRSNHYWAESLGTPADPSNQTDAFNQDFPSRHMEEFFNKLNH